MPSTILLPGRSRRRTGGPLRPYPSRSTGPPRTSRGVRPAGATGAKRSSGLRRGRYRGRRAVTGPGTDDGTKQERGGRMDLVESGSVGGFFALRTTRRLPAAPTYRSPGSTRGGRPPHRARGPGRRPARRPRAARRSLRRPPRARGPPLVHRPRPRRPVRPLPRPGPGRAALGRGPDLPDDLWWAGSATRPATAADLRAAVQEAHLVPLHAALRRDGRMATRLLWGNAGSALAGALRELTRWARAHGRPDAADRAAALVAELLDHPDLAGTVRGPGCAARAAASTTAVPAADCAATVSSTTPPNGFGGAAPAP